MRKIKNIKLNNIILDPRYAAILEPYKIGVIGDLHIGMSNTIYSLEVNLMFDNIKKLIKDYKLKQLIINGDIKHSFGKKQGEKSSIKWLIDRLDEIIDLIIIKGNHDFYLESIIRRQGLKTYEIGEFIISHGDIKINKKDKTLILSNEHPSITLRDELGAYIKLPCFLFFRKEKILVLPSSNILVKGSNVLTEESFLSKNLKGIDKDNAEVYAINDNEVLFFGTIGKLKELRF